MPFKSKAQQRAMEAKAGRGEISKATIEEFEAATKRQPGGFKGLPERAGKPAAPKMRAMPMKPGSPADKMMEKRMGIKPGSAADKRMEAGKMPMHRGKKGKC